MYKEKEAHLTFFKGNKRISEKDYLIYAEENRTGAKGAEMIARFEEHWFYVPTHCTVVLDGWRYYFRIRYTDRKENGRIIHLPEFRYTTRRKATTGKGAKV
jgi:hypothetical protein